ncbi:aminopeptidase P family protein [Candidatus Bathyarchaeota archaeon]|nr:aminopeptidase P family protein [Candidatus Bathyarchaeota archaeon]
MKLKISYEEYKRRVKKVKEELSNRNLDLLLLTGDKSIFYICGFTHIATERPAVLGVPLDGDLFFMGPLLEADHMRLQTSLVKEIRTYIDYPGEKHPIKLFAKWLTELGFGKSRIGADNPMGATGIYGYVGPPLNEEMPEAKFIKSGDIIWNMRLIKSSEEVELIRESAKWGNLAHHLLQEYTSPGMWDAEVSMLASYEASSIMKKTLGLEYEPIRAGRTPASAGFRGQVGWKSAIPHSIGIGRNIQEGDILVTGAGADVGGYSSELERTMIVGKPSAKQERYFEVMVKSQEAAMDAMAPGVKCSEIDRIANKVIAEAGYGNLIRHHTGHGIGLEGHEPPWLDVGNDLELKPGMIVSCEPGIYEIGYGGFRHSDTILITGEGCEVITYYPRDLESLTIL